MAVVEVEIKVWGELVGIGGFSLKFSAIYFLEINHQKFKLELNGVIEFRILHTLVWKALRKKAKEILLLNISFT